MFFETTSIFLNITEILLWLTFISFIINKTIASGITQKLSRRNISIKKSFEELKKTIISKAQTTKTQIIRPRTTAILLITFLTINITTAFLSKDNTLSLLFSFKIIEGIIFAWLITQQILSKKEIALTLLVLAIFQSSIAIGQFILQHDLGLQFIGEPTLNQSLLGVAKMNIGPEKLIRGYGTFAHPNILAAFFVILFFYFDSLKWNKLKYFILIPLFFTFSRSAFLAVFIGLIVKALGTKNKLKKTIGAFFVICIFSGLLYTFFPERFNLDHAFFERIDLIKTSGKMFLANPLGIGNANFLLHIQDFAPHILKPWEFQPVHNMYLLILNENGIFGLTAFIGLIFSILFKLLNKQKNSLPLFLAVLIIALADHYFWDIDSGRWLFWTVIGLTLFKTDFLQDTNKKN